MTLFLNQPAHAFAQFIAPLVTKVIEKIMESSASQQPSRSLPEPLTPEEASRGVPQGTLAGTMSPPKGRLVLMDGKVKRLAPGSRIYDSKNRIVLPVDAVVDEGVESFVFQQNGDHFDRVPVQKNPNRAPSRTPVTHG